MRLIVQEAAWYDIASLCPLCIDVVLPWVLMKFLSASCLLAATLSFMSGATIVHTLSLYCVFGYHRLRDRRAAFAGFVALGLSGRALNASVISVLLRCFGVHYLKAKCAAAVTTFSWNFLARRQILFLRK